MNNQTKLITLEVCLYSLMIIMFIFLILFNECVVVTFIYRGYCLRIFLLTLESAVMPLPSRTPSCLHRCQSTLSYVLTPRLNQGPFERIILENRIEVI